MTGVRNQGAHRGSQLARCSPTTSCSRRRRGHDNTTRYSWYFLPNEAALIDPVIVIAHLHGQFGVRLPALADQVEAPAIRALGNLLGVLRVPVQSELD